MHKLPLYKPYRQLDYIPENNRILQPDNTVVEHRII